MREIDVRTLIPKIRELCIEATTVLPDDVLQALEQAHDRERNSLAQSVLATCIGNHRIAALEHLPLCQDTGVAVFFLEIGQDVHFVGGDLYTAIQEGVRQGYRDGYLRKSMVADPVIVRKNTGDNTPAIIHTAIVPGDRFAITLAPKGGGAENMSAIRMLTPAAGLDGVTEFVVETVRNAGGNPCPPVIVGVGIGGDFELAAILSKKALLRPLDEPNPDPTWNQLEQTWLERINELDVGPQGLGGDTTALAVHILHHPCHLASLPVAVNLQCHAARHKRIIL